MRPESTRSLKIALCLLFTWQLAACTTTGDLQTARTVCPADCGLDVSLPRNQGSPPDVARGQTEIHVKHGALMAATLKDHRSRPAKAATRLVFIGENPFVKSEGDPLVIDLELDKVIFLKVRSDLPRCREEDKAEECKDGYRVKFKYNIVNHGNSRRPVRDPWIIIER